MATNPDTITDTQSAPADDLSAVDTLYGASDPEPQNDAPGDEPASEGDESPQDDAPEPEPIAVPMSWAKDARDVFGTLPREAQEIIAAREADRERFVATKGNEAVKARQEVEREARALLTHRAQEHAQQLQRYAAMFEPQAPDIRLLQSGNEQDRALYYQLDAEYRTVSAQRDHAQREAQDAASQAEALEQQQLQAEMAEQHRILADQIPEWSEPSARSKLLTDLGSIGGELGYTQEQMREARASDILALRKAAEWKADADKYRALYNRQRTQPARDAKQQLPRVARPGTGGAEQPAATDDLAALYPNDVRR